jgi:lipopolysaccharide export LptBFGC system permease protein LptF
MSRVTHRPLASLPTALFGIATRRALLDYLRMVGLILFILLATAWTIDLAGNYAGIAADAERRGLSLAATLLPYLGYRTADMVTRMLPMACFFGVYLAEIARRARLETVILKAAGASPVRMLSAVLLFALLLGTLQARLEQSWRPAAVAAQIELGYGSYARRFRNDWTHFQSWLVSGDTAIRAELKRDQPPEMRDVLIFTGINAPHLKTIYSAARALPGDTPRQWRLLSGSKWQAEQGMESAEAFDEMTLTLDLIPEQISYYDEPAFYIPTEPLRAIARMRNAPTAANADVALWRRRTVWTLPGTFALLAFCLASAGFGGRTANVPRLIALACLGYFAVVSVKVFWALGELAAVPAAASVLSTVGAVLLLSAVLIRRQS